MKVTTGGLCYTAATADLVAFIFLLVELDQLSAGIRILMVIMFILYGVLMTYSHK